MSLDQGRVLVADDEQGLRDILSRSLARAGFVVEAVSNGKEAAKKLRASVFDVLLADINMPGNSNLELLDFIREEQALLPVVLMTGEPTVDSAVGALRRGVVDYVTKPLDLDELVVRLTAAIKRGGDFRALADAQQRALVFSNSVAALELAITVFGTRASQVGSAVGHDARGDPLANLSAEDLSRLSPREREITRLLALGNGVANVAALLELSPNTVRNHIKSIFAKLRVHTQIALLSKLAGHGQ